MLQPTRKPGRPRKYASKEEKARQDVIAKRARRRLQICRFRVNTAPKTQIGPLPAPSLHQAYLQPLDRLSSLAEVACSVSPITTGPDLLPHSVMHATTTVGLEPYLQRVNYPTTDNTYVSPYVLRLPPPRSTLSMSPRPEDACTQLRHPEATSPSMSPTYEPMQWDGGLHGGQGDDETLGSGFRAGRPATTDAVSGEGNNLEQGTTPLPDPLRGTGGPSTNYLRDVNRVVSGDVVSSRQEEGGVDPAVLEGCSSPRDSDIDPLHGNDFEVETETETESELESESESQSNWESGRAKVQHMPREQSCTIEPSPLSAKKFLETAWNSRCRCKQDKRPGPDASNAFDLEQMVDYWKELGVPDSMSHSSPGQARTDEHEDGDLDWCAILAGGDNRPHLCFEKSQHVAPTVQHTWDVDSIICWTSCLSINLGLYVSYSAPVSRNMQSSVHVFHDGKPLHTIPHLRLGSGRQSPQFSVYVFFPGIRHARRTTSYLTNEERRL